jgi:hypothetical protein
MSEFFNLKISYTMKSKLTGLLKPPTKAETLDRLEGKLDPFILAFIRKDEDACNLIFYHLRKRKNALREINFRAFEFDVMNIVSKSRADVAGKSIPDNLWIDA